MSDYYYFHTPPPPALAQPGGPQPSIWLLAGSSNLIRDHRGAGHCTGSGSLPLTNTYPGGKKAWVFDGATQLAITDHLLNTSSNMVFAFQFAAPDYAGQHYLMTLGNGSGAGPGHVDSYTDGSQFIFRSNSPAGLGSSISHYMLAPGEANSLAYFLNHDNDPAEPTLRLITPQAPEASFSSDFGHVDPGVFANEPVFLFSGGYGGGIPFVPNTLIRSVLAWPVTAGVSPDKVRGEWHPYLDSLP
ncbi:hypothetical protein [Hymenobacter algoricola]|uniref:Uncharacterized protein n=1 Tax=Hymenobacter algoricola TaxID=486267 RepID=A0ABP7N995_9BACT